MMEFRKTVLAGLNMPYALGAIEVGGEKWVMAGTEDHGPLLISRPPYGEAAEMVAGPGGCMAIVADPGRAGDAFAIMECFLGYKFQTGGVYRLRSGQAAGSGRPEWMAEKVLPLPFAHRVEVVDRGGSRFLVAATIAADKRDAADWEKPGAVYASPLPRAGEEAWNLVPVLKGLHRNHGFLVTRLQGVRVLLISCAEGLFMHPLETPGEEWSFTRVLDREISEIAVADLDGDGHDELVTIEPFHGNSVRVYRHESGRWQPAWEAELTYGHCLLAGKLGGVPGILVSNRAGSRDLVLFQFSGSAAGSGGRFPRPVGVTVDAGAGAANMLVIRHGGTDLVFSTNQAAGEIALYTPTRV